ncbi:MAG: DNA replication complex GINS family protein [Thermoplasmata archaeon]|nr:MAG: DNA replication complex GINS family protein [Thermoplasmata archaeon]
MLTYSKLRNIEQNEKMVSSLTSIGIDFYQEALSYISELEEKIEEERRKDPASRKLLLLSDELRNTKRILNNIFERREKKIIMAALLAARAARKPPENMTREEKIFYENLVELLKENRRKIFELKRKEFLTIRILKDLPQFVGNDMKKYSLRKEDVISLPLDVAKILIEREAAEEIKPAWI